MASEAQLTLPLCPPTPASFEQFIGDEANDAAVRALRHFLATPNETLFFLAGEEGTGKTHLLTAACAEVEHLGARCAYAPLAEAVALSPELLSDWEQYDLICLDDLDAIAARNDWEETVFHLFNRVRDAGHRLLISAPRLPALLDIELPDLRSRLQWGTSFRLRMPDDALKQLILKNRAHQRPAGRLPAASLRPESRPPDVLAGQAGQGFPGTPTPPDAAVRALGDRRHGIRTAGLAPAASPG